MEGVIWQLKDLQEYCEKKVRGEADTWNTDVIALRQAIKALEKQIPKKPIERDYEGYICPTCEEGQLIQPEVVDSEYQISNYCNVCGQKIDWE